MSLSRLLTVSTTAFFVKSPSFFLSLFPPQMASLKAAEKIRDYFIGKVYQARKPLSDPQVYINNHRASLTRDV